MESNLYKKFSTQFELFQKEEIEQSIANRFEKQVAKYPDHLAIKSKNHTLTYQELNKLANQIARVILSRKDLKKEAIVILIEQGSAFIFTLLGVLKSGKFYVPVDPSFPKLRNAYIIQNSQSKLIITNHKNLEIAENLAPDSCEILNIDELDPNLPTDNLKLPISPDDIANIIYTSGSTGKPKGVVQNHHNLLHNCRNYTNPMRISPADRMTLLHSCSVMGAVNGIFNALLNGATLCPFDVKQEGLANLPSWLIDQEITIYYSVTTLFRHFTHLLTTTSQFKDYKFKDLRLIRLGGEPVLAKDMEQYKKYFSQNCLLYIGLGSTETGAIQLFIANKETQIYNRQIPLGDSVEDLRLLLLNQEGHEVGHGEIGEICVQSQYIALGYWQDPERTKTAFLPDPTGGCERIYRTGDLGKYLPNGELVHQGRKDFQVKIRGYRVEIGEIETALLDHDIVKETAVIGAEDTSGAKCLIAYIVPMGMPDHFSDQQERTLIAKLRRQMKERLPDYMVPSRFVLLKSLPLTPNGKVDRRKLPDPGPTLLQYADDFVAPRTPTEKALADIWASVLSIKEIGVHNNFFTIGGHSLSATQVISRIKDTLQIELSLRNLLEAPTISELALNVTQHQLESLESAEIEDLLSEIEEPSDRHFL